jgi:LacI family transcriptional regulator
MATTKRTPRGSSNVDEPSGRRVTIRDVARETGVSVSAVSKVLRGAYGVSPAMRDKVTRTMERLGYRPHAGARTLRGRSYTVGVMLVRPSSAPFQAEVAEGINDELLATPFQDVIVAAGVSPERQTRSIEALVDRNVDGLILIAPGMSHDWLEVLGAAVPTVVVARHGGASAFDTVVDDDFEGARLLVDHLVDLGHTSIAHTCDPAGLSERPFVLPQAARRDGYESAMRRHGIEPDVLAAPYSEEGGYRGAMELLTRPRRPTAIFAGADISALGALRAAEELGLRVPEDLTIVGYDNIYAAGIGRVSLTTVDQSGHNTGSVSARLLLERLEGRTRPVHYVIAPRLVVRGTSGPPPGARAAAYPGPSEGGRVNR